MFLTMEEGIGWRMMLTLPGMNLDGTQENTGGSEAEATPADPFETEMTWEASSALGK